MNISNRARLQMITSSQCDELTLADYASTSGIPLRLPSDIWVNVPIVDYNPNFVTTTPFSLDWNGKDYILQSESNKWSVIPTPVPHFATKPNSIGEPHIHFGLTHTDRVRISPISGCANNCKFCDLPRTFAYRCKPVELLEETIHAALNDPILPAKHILISGGTPKEEDYLYLRNVYEHILAAFPSTPIDIMMLPLPGVMDLQSLKQQGLNGLSINLELFDNSWRKKMIVEKNTISKDAWLDFIETGVNIFGSEVRSMLMVGLEPMENTLQGVEALAQRGCTPVLSPFRPALGTPLHATPPPAAEFLIETFLRATEICVEYGVKLGPRCIPCQHNTITLPDGSSFYQH